MGNNTGTLQLNNIYTYKFYVKYDSATTNNQTNKNYQITGGKKKLISLELVPKIAQLFYVVYVISKANMERYRTFVHKKSTIYHVVYTRAVQKTCCYFHFF